SKLEYGHSTESALLVESVARRVLLLILQQQDIRIGVTRAQQPVGEEIHAPYQDIARERRVGVAHAGKYQHLEALVGVDERAGQLHGIRQIDVVIHVAGGQHEMAAQVSRQRFVLLYRVD